MRSDRLRTGASADGLIARAPGQPGSSVGLDRKVFPEDDVLPLKTGCNGQLLLSRLMSGWAVIKDGVFRGTQISFAYQAL